MRSPFHFRIAKRLIIPIVIAGLLIGIRIWWVNHHLPQIPVESYKEKTWVPLEGAFEEVANENGEGTKHYSLMVESAVVRTYDDYLEAHGVTPAHRGAHGTTPCVVDVAIRVRNDGPGQGGLSIFSMVLVSERQNQYFVPDVFEKDSLWPQVQKGANSTISIKPGTEFVMHIPYVTNDVGADMYATPITDLQFYLLASRMPTRKLINVSATVD
ncbi:hypothetical protein [Olegusella massiliensis]|uniref:hypothetical protein n=1 Tax=Olegusella massiliensis TaxID=1776381 RepID=UPI0023F93787|nr:hypothetical protein [Olegusella massiliensis]